VITNQQLNRYFEEYGDQELTFTRQVNQILGLMPKYVYLKCQADTLPCILYSSSMRGAKVIANLHLQSLRLLQQSSGSLALRFCFAREAAAIPLAFFVSARLTAQTAYNRETPELYFLSLEYTHRPPDDLIEILGGMQEANRNAQKRAEERIEVTPASMKLLGLESREAALSVGGAEARYSGTEGRCLLRDLSFSGAKVLVHGRAEDFLEKPVLLRPAFVDPKAQVTLSGRVLRWEGMANREDIGAIAILFDRESIPIQYKMAINAGLRALLRDSGLPRR
jgi:hypothetical protein